MCLCTALQAEAQHSKTSWHAVSRVFRYIHPEVNATHYCADTQTNTHTLQTTSAWMTLIFLRSFFSTLPHIYFLALRFLQRVKTHWAVFRVCISTSLCSLCFLTFLFPLCPSLFHREKPKDWQWQKDSCACVYADGCIRALNRKWFVDINNSPLSLPTVTLHGTHSTLNYSVFSLIQIQNPLHALASAVPAPKTLSTLQWSSPLKSHIGRINSDNKYEHTLTCFKQMRLFSKVIIYYL